MTWMTVGEYHLSNLLTRDILLPNQAWMGKGCEQFTLGKFKFEIFKFLKCQEDDFFLNSKEGYL